MLYRLLSPEFPIFGNKGILLLPDVWAAAFTWKIYFLLSRRTKEGESDLALTVKVTLIQNNQYAIEAHILGQLP